MEVISSIYNSGYNIKKFYLGSRELNLAYLGNQVIYDEVIGDNDLNYILYEFYGSDTLPNTVEAPVKSATLKGSTKYRDIDTGDILDTFDETKNLELVSVKVPVLKTVGKNLFNRNGKLFDGWLHNGGSFVEVIGGGLWTTDFIETKNESYISFSGINSDFINFVFFDGYYNIVGSRINNVYTVQIPMNAKYIRITFNKSDTDTFQIEYGNKSTSYEPYKSNILTVNEEVELRGIGEVQDELNLLTGELTERIGEITFDGSDDETWGRNGTLSNNYETSFFTLSVDNVKRSIGHITKICDKFPVLADYSHTKDIEGVTQVTDNQMSIRVLKTSLSDDSVEGLKAYLQSNPITVQYQFITKSVKTVDLTIVDQDGKTINKLNSFNGTTHVSTDVAENSAYPMVSLEVASELQAAMSKVTEDIELIKPVQNDIETTIDTQSNDIDSLLLATTELFEMFL